MEDPLPLPKMKHRLLFPCVDTWSGNINAFFPDTTQISGPISKHSAQFFCASNFVGTVFSPNSLHPGYHCRHTPGSLGNAWEQNLLHLAPESHTYVMSPGLICVFFLPPAAPHPDTS